MFEMFLTWLGEVIGIGIIGFIIIGGLGTTFLESGIEFDTYKFHKQSDSGWSLAWLFGLWSSLILLIVNIYIQGLLEIEGRYSLTICGIGSIVWYLIGAYKKPKNWQKRKNYSGI